MKKRKFGLIGKTLKHSFSPSYFQSKFEKERIFDAEYNLHELASIDEFRQLISEHKFVGLNVTIPYKKEILSYVDILDESSKEIGAINTIHFHKNKLYGYNTDVIGFCESLKTLQGRKKVERALILGTGGASMAIKHGLSLLGIQYSVVSRKSGDYLYEDLNKDVIKDHRLIINCTPLGTFPDIEASPKIPYQHLNKKHLLFDLVYNPKKTLFLKYGEEKGCSILNGYPMLIKQAEASWKIWNHQ